MNAQKISPPEGLSLPRRASSRSLVGIFLGTYTVSGILTIFRLRPLWAISLSRHANASVPLTLLWPGPGDIFAPEKNIFKFSAKSPRGLAKAPGTWYYMCCDYARRN